MKPRACAWSNRRNPVNLSPDLGHEERAYVFAVAMKYVKDEDAAADVAQDALLLAHRHRAKFRGDSRYSTWLYRIAASAALMYLRKNRRRAREVLVGDKQDEAVVFADLRTADGGGLDDQLANKQAVGIVEQRLAQLGDKYGRIFWMRYLEGYTETEIARHLQLSLATVKTRAHRARVAVRETLRAAA